MAAQATIDDIMQLFRESEKQSKETKKTMLELFARTEQARLKTEQSIDRMSATVAETSKLVGNLGSRWGEFLEGLIAPACISLFTARGIKVDEVHPRVKKTVNGRHMEIDLLVANTVDAVLVEVKSHLTVGDIRHHLKRIEEFKNFFPRYADCQVYGAVAGIVVDAQADQFAINQGLFVIEQSGETVRLANDHNFDPRIW